MVKQLQIFFSSYLSQSRERGKLVRRVEEVSHLHLGVVCERVLERMHGRNIPTELQLQVLLMGYIAEEHVDG